MGHNLANDLSRGFTAAGDIIAEPLLSETLEDNGAPTATQVIPYRSPAIDAGSNDHCTDADQRGYPRPVSRDIGGTSIFDIGAYEWRILPPAPPLSGNFAAAG